MYTTPYPTPHPRTHARTHPRYAVDGENEANSTQEHWWEGAEKDKSAHAIGPKIRAPNRWCQEATSVPSGYRRIARHSKIPTEHQLIDPASPISTFGSGNCSKLQRGHTFPVHSFVGVARGIRSIPNWFVRRQQFMCDPREKSDHHGQRHTSRPTHSG